MSILARRTLSSNTGYDSQPAFQVGVDWLDITYRSVRDMHELERLIDECDRITGDVTEWSSTKPVFNGRMWDGSGVGVRGTRVWIDTGSDGDDGDFKPMQLKLALPGSVMGQACMKRLSVWMTANAARCELDCTRIDLCLDDRDKFIKLWKIAHAFRRGNFFNASSGEIDISGKRGQDKGMSIYFGHPLSFKRLVAYDKGIESKGRIKGNRWEGRFRKAAAMNVLLDVIGAIEESEEKFVSYCKNAILGIIDFRNRRDGDKNRFRCPVLRWFQEFQDRLSACPVRVRVEVRVPTVQRSIDWIERSVAQSLSIVSMVLGSDFEQFFQGVLKSGEDRLSLKKRELIKSTKKDSLIYA